MINLLSPQDKKQLAAARANTVVRNYFGLLILTVVLLAGVLGYGFKATLDAQSQAQAAKALAEQQAMQYESTRTQAVDFTKDLTVAKTILGTGTSFSQLLINIAEYVPPGVILSNLSLSATQQNAPITMSARAKTDNDAIKLKNSLEQSAVFEKVNIISITSSEGETASAYPVAVSLSATFTKTKAGQ